MSLRRWKASNQPNGTLWPVAAEIPEPNDRQATPTAEKAQPIMNFPISSGSGKRLAQARQNQTIRIRVATETIESTDISQLVRIVTPNRCRSALLSAHSR